MNLETFPKILCERVSKNNLCGLFLSAVNQTFKNWCMECAKSAYYCDDP